MKRLSLLSKILFLTLIISSCGQSKPSYKNVSFRGQVFGTMYSVSYFTSGKEVTRQEVEAIFENFNNSMSYYVPNSIVSKINRNETDIADEYIVRVFRKSMEISHETDGAFDITVSPLVNLWGFGFEKMGDVSKGKIDSILDFVGYENVKLENGRIIKQDSRISLDFNAIAKGYAVDVLGKYLESNGINIYMVEIGGDLIAKGLKPDGSKWKIGIEKPANDLEDPQDWQYLVELDNQAIATSGNYRRYYEKDGLRYSHTINPKTGYPVNHNLLSVSVVAKDAMTADAYATAFMVMGLEKTIEFVKNRNDIEVFLIYSTGQDEFGTYVSPGLKVVERE
jgi:FAD:protein FMN transferase